MLDKFMIVKQTEDLTFYFGGWRSGGESLPRWQISSRHAQPFPSQAEAEAFIVAKLPLAARILRVVPQERG